MASVEPTEVRQWPGRRPRRRSAVAALALVTVLAMLLATPAPAWPATPTTQHSGASRSGQLRGWDILSDDQSAAVRTIDAAGRYHINHLELSQDLVMNLAELRDPTRRARVNGLIEAAHRRGIGQVTLWDHQLQQLSYYPEEFRTGPGGTLDLDNPAFWAWLKADYRRLLDLTPHVDGIVLTFIETGAQIENQYSHTLKTPEEKLAKLLSEIDSVVIGERHLALYARIFGHSPGDYARTVPAVNLVRDPKLVVMEKETPYDFDPYTSPWSRNNPGVWVDPPYERVHHGVNKTFHYWIDVNEHLAPAWTKTPEVLGVEEQYVLDNGWAHPVELMNMAYLRDVITEKDYGVAQARRAVAEIEKARQALDPADYAQLHGYFERTLLTAELYRQVLPAYFGYRIYARGAEYRTPKLSAIVSHALCGTEAAAARIDAYPDKPGAGQYVWADDAGAARHYVDLITQGWDEYGGVAFPAPNCASS